MPQEVELLTRHVRQTISNSQSTTASTRMLQHLLKYRRFALVFLKMNAGRVPPLASASGLRPLLVEMLNVFMIVNTL